MVLAAAENCGMKVEIGPINLEDASLWEELFLTSSIRLIIPIQKVIVGSGVKSDHSEAIWIVRKVDKESMYWRRIYGKLSGVAS